MDIQRQGQLVEVLGSEMSNKYSVKTTDSSANTKTHSFDGRFLIPEPVVKFFHDGRKLEISPNKDEDPYAAIARYVFELNDEIEKLKSELAKAQAVPEVAQRQGGYYIRDLRSQPGNCMKFWYQAGYGTKHKNFFWCATLEEAQKYKGGCDWFEIWHAPYIDSLVEYTVDFQLADRGVGLVDLKAQEPAND